VVEWGLVRFLRSVGRLVSARGVRLIVLAFLLLLLSISLTSSNIGRNPITEASAQTGAGKTIVVIEMDVPIDQGATSLTARGIASAEADSAAAVIINMNTPGGSLNDMISIVDTISNSTVPVYTYVGNDSGATSAGSYIAMATDKIFMGPGSQIGPSTPYILGGGTALEQNHTTDYAISFMVALAQEHGRNVTAVTQMAAYNVAYDYTDALKYHVADASSYSLGQTISMLNLTGASVVTISETPTEQLVSLLSNAIVDGILLLLGIVAIVIDFLHPTIVLSIAGAVLIALGIIGTEAIENGNGSSAIALPLVLFACAAALIVLELKTGHGFMLMAGIAVGVLGTVLLTYQIPYSPSPFGNVQYLELGLFLVVGGLLALYTRWVGNAIRKKPFTGSETLIGKTGLALTALAPQGDVSIEGIIWKARLTGPGSNKVERGSRVIVVSRSGLTLEVEPEPIKQKVEVQN
jgi:membrane-bound serine protease (ClpP class)